jgi:hypothetical protein
MTLIAAFRYRDGLILGSDSQETRGAPGRRLARPTQKVYVPRPGFLLAWAGPQNVAQGFALRLARARISPSADRLEIEARLKAILGNLRKDESIEERSDHIELLLAWWSRKESKPLALRLFSGGATEWVDSWAFAGARIGVENASFAMGTLRYIDLGVLTLDHAQVVALKVLRDVIATTAEGIGGRVQMGTVQKDSVQRIEEADMRGQEDTVNLWESRCAELLLGATSTPSASATPDRGVRPPG